MAASQADFLDAPDQTLTQAFAAGALRLRIACACGRASELPERLALARFGRDATLPEIARRGRCSQCGRLGAAQASMTRPEPITASRPVLSHLATNEAPQPRPLRKRRRRAGPQAIE